uniref:Nudix hydrolase domain-containing protein n=1 Tax=Panagrellus redivivus TaxID=6233 RepID=A0A7E4VEJ4_PANRE
MKKAMSLVGKIHVKCRDTKNPYLKSNIHRTEVPADKIPWSVPWSDYEPVDYTDKNIVGKPWADPELQDGKFRFNELDGQVNRKSYICKYSLDKDGAPLNPIGRTGLRGRGILGRWGPNHAADPIVSRIVDGKLQFVAIQRSDTGEWAIPGGMVDAGETVSATLKREFTEEALNNVSAEALEDLWKNGTTLYEGYVDDPRNTDNAWMETSVVNFHDREGVLEHVEFKAGDDATAVRWVTLNRQKPENLYASHEDFINILMKHHNL